MYFEAIVFHLFMMDYQKKKKKNEWKRYNEILIKSFLINKSFSNPNTSDEVNLINNLKCFYRL